MPFYVVSRDTATRWDGVSTSSYMVLSLVMLAGLLTYIHDIYTYRARRSAPRHVVGENSISSQYLEYY